jgi:hypothetical protein
MVAVLISELVLIMHRSVLLDNGLGFVSVADVKINK